MSASLFILAALLSPAAPIADDATNGISPRASFVVAVGQSVSSTPATTEPETAAAPAAIAPGQTLPAAPLPNSSEPKSEAAPRQDDIVITSRKSDPRDPLAAVNVRSFAATAAVDEAVGRPVALAYKRTVPKPVRSGIRNFFFNLHEPVVFFNFLLQHKFGKAGETLGRFAINSTIGGGGLFDVAKRRPFKLPRRANGFADTLGFYGIKPGPFFYMPMLGPTTLRDVAGGFIDRLFSPVPLGKPFSSPAFNLSTSVIRAMDHRAEIDDRIHALRDGPENDYDASRDFYLTRRQAEIDQLRRKPRSPNYSPVLSVPPTPMAPNPSAGPAAGTPQTR